MTLAEQAAVEIAEAIRAGTLAGDAGLLPAETVLSQRLDISRATLREALSRLQQSGLIVRRPGIGTFVNPSGPPMDTGLEELESIETLAQKMGVSIHMGACQVEQRRATASEAHSLQVTDATAVVAVQRVIHSADRPIAYLVDVIRADVLAPTDLQDSFDGSILDLLLRRGRPLLKQSTMELTAEAASRDLAKRLSLPLAAPLLKFTAQLYSNDGQIVDCSESYFSPNQFRFHIIRRVKSPI